MRKIYFLFSFLLAQLYSFAQNPVPMAGQPVLTYLENFDSIASWGNSFSSGAGADRFSSVPAGGAHPVPDPLRVTTSSAFWTSQSSGGLQKDTVNGKLMMLVTGTANNSSSLAFDFFMDFTGINAGTLSFDWSTVFNGATSSNRNGRLNVYATIDGINFTELTAASVTITNYVPASGTVLNVPLPSVFNQNPQARLRFYYYNAAGGTTGSRPLIALDNIKITASGTFCTTPSASAANLQFFNSTAVSVHGSFSPANPVPDEYLVIASSLGGLTANPQDSFVYNPGDIVGDGTVIYRGSDTSFTASGLSPQTTYTFYVFSLNIYCSGIILYKVQNPLTGVFTTPAGPPCVPPSVQPSQLLFSNSTSSSISGSFSGVNDASEYLIVASQSPTLGQNPVDGTVYNAGDPFGNGTVVYRGSQQNFVANGLQHSTIYYFFIFSLNNFACSNGPAYLQAPPLTGQNSTLFLFPCSAPAGPATDLIFHEGVHSINGFFNPYAGGADGYLVLMSQNSGLTALPQDGTVYQKGMSLGGGTIIGTGKNFSFSALGLIQNSTYHFFVFTYNDICIGGPVYQSANFLSGTAATTDDPAFKTFFGNLHAHSSYSDGNKDHPSLRPADDFDYAKNTLCMDFLGISEHNHFSAHQNPGMLLANYQQGLYQADSFTQANPGFLALYGMEWGTISNGGHVLVYGVDSLIGWETIQGAPNYDIFVAKNDYLSDSGLFRKVSNFSSDKAFATLAHPSFNEFQSLAYISHNPGADSVLVGIAIESGPAFSTDTSYNNPGSSFSFLSYYLHMLSKGYRVGPMIDHDNHNTTFGRTAKSRTAVIASSINKNDFMDALNKMRFYATQDCDITAEIFVYGNQMGSEIVHSFAPAISVNAAISAPVQTLPEIKLYSGIPGTGSLPSVLKTVQGNSLDFTDHSLPDSTTAYYFAEITVGTKKALTAPIWYQRTDTGIISAVAGIKKTETKLRLLKNPAGSTLNFELSTHYSGIFKAHIYDICGRKLIQKEFRMNNGPESFILPVSLLSPGIYILEISMEKEKFRQKFLHE